MEFSPKNLNILGLFLILVSGLLAWGIKNQISIEEKLDVISFSKKVLKYNVGIANDAYHFKNDPKNIFYTATYKRSECQM